MSWLPHPTLAAQSVLGIDILNLVLVLAAAWTAGRIAVRFGYPAVLGELIAGITLGPPLLSVLASGPGLEVIGNLGVVLMMLYIGTEIELADLRRASWAGLLAASGGFLVPAGLGFFAVVAFGGSVLAALFVAISVGVTSLATKSRILIDLRLLDTRIAYVLMAGALLSDTATLVVFAAIIGFVELGSFDLVGTATVATEAIVFFVLTFAIGLVALPRVGRWLTSRGGNDRMSRFAAVIVTGLLFAELAEIAGLHAILGSFVAGMFVRKPFLEDRVGRQANRLLGDLSVGFLAPIFFVSAGFETSFGVFRTDLALAATILVIAVLGKIIGTSLFYLPTGHGWREGLVVGAAMNGRGAVEIIVAGIGLELGLISREIFTILVFMAIITTAAVPVLLKLGVDWLRRRGELDRTANQRRGVVILGAGPVARLLGGLLSHARPVCLVDRNAHRCAQARHDDINAVRGDGMDLDVLDQAGAGTAEVFIALTSNTEVNVLAAQSAHEDFLVPNVYVAVEGEPASAPYERLLERVGARRILDGSVDIDLWDHRLATGAAGPHDITVRESVTVEQAVRLHDGRESLPLIVEREGEVIPFQLVDQLLPGDRVTVLTTRAFDDPPVSGERTWVEPTVR